ncbi:MAG TPA: EutN/CcmL family microcompartment protein [Streptosporangiaceae bacterium]|nr:EutN/CcmL family microcompartment protein [Streptosporangiaceae bacterium]
MLQAIVVGNVWSTKRIDGLPSGAFLQVRVVESGDCLVAFDVLGTGLGERVLIAQGSVASGWLPDRPPVDALIIGSIDEPADAADATPADNKASKGSRGSRSGKAPGSAGAAR